jgi:hypothetical protein
MIRSMVASAFLLAAAQLCFAADPFVGTWKLNVDKSKVTGASLKDRPAVKVEPDGNDLRFGANVIRLDGSEREEGNLLMLSRRVDTRILLSSGKQNGKIVFEAIRAVADDGRTMTMTSYTTSKTGERFYNLLVYERQ